MQKKFSQSLPDAAYDILEDIAKERQIPSVQELIRSVIIPDWVRKNAKEISSQDPSFSEKDLEAGHR